MAGNCQTCRRWDHIEEMGEYGDCWNDVKVPDVAAWRHKNSGCKYWEATQCKPSPDTLFGFPVVYAERSSDAPPAEDIICGSWNDVHVGLTS